MRERAAVDNQPNTVAPPAPAAPATGLSHRQLLRDPQLAEFRAGKRRLVGAAAAQLGNSEAVYDGFEMATLAKEHALREGSTVAFSSSGVCD